jgi:hypothetical protein
MCTVGVWGHCPLAGLEAEDVSETLVDSIGDQLQELFAHRDRIDAEIQRRLHRFDKGQGYTADGALSAQAWLRWKCRLSGGEASERVKVARKLVELDTTAKAFAAGEVSYRHAALIARTASELGEKWETNAESILVTAAKELDPGRLRYAVGHLKYCLAPDGVLNEANQNYERRSVHLSQTLDGLFRLDGQLDSEGGAALKTAIDSLMLPPAESDDRTPAQRRADALVELARQQLDAGNLPRVAGQKPHLFVNARLSTLVKEPGSRAAELEWSQPIPAETARRIACDCTLTPVIDGEAHGSGRVVPGWMRRQLVARDKRCRFEGCDVPPAWTDAHHIRHWADGGVTKLWNLVLLCRRHHRMVHEGGWNLVESGDNVLQAIPP